MILQNTDHPVTGPRGEKVNQLFLRLRDAVFSGQYAPGQRLIEADLTRDHGVSRGPLREAFRQLAADGLVEIIPNRGAVVRRLSRKAMEDLFLIRQSLEGLAASLAAANMVRDDYRKRFRDAAKTIAELRKTKTPEKFTQENALLHQIIVELADNPQLAALVNQLQLPLMRFQIRSALNQSHRDQSSKEHDKIIKAILAGDHVRAGASMHQHLKRASKQIAMLDDTTFIR
jgi:DNA-binding GntR family transcriptional regulator